jgi:hypothetical protein
VDGEHVDAIYIYTYMYIYIHIPRSIWIDLRELLPHEGPAVGGHVDVELRGRCPSLRSIRRERVLN